MSVLASLARAYERLPDRPPFGFSTEKIGLLVSLFPNGEIATVNDLRSSTGDGVSYAISMHVPQAIKRTSAIAPNFLWDKTSYALGVTAEVDAQVAQKHAAFVQLHEKVLMKADDEGFYALLAFLHAWSADQFKIPFWKPEYKDLNVVFGLERERSLKIFLHTRPAAKTIVPRLRREDDRPSRVCLITGKVDTVARLHPAIKGVRGAHRSGAALVSFALAAFESYGHEQGDNAQISQSAAFAYATALNRFLSRDSGHFIQIGETSVVFWAEAHDTQAATLAESHFQNMIDAPGSENEKPSRDDFSNMPQNPIHIRRRIQNISRARIIRGDRAIPTEGVRFHVLALAPHNGRLSIRFYSENNFSMLEENYNAYCQDVAIEPWPTHFTDVSLRVYASRAGRAWRDSNGKVFFSPDSTSAQTLDELLRVFLTGVRFPRSLLATLVMRVRRDGVLDVLRVSLIKAIIIRERRLTKTTPEDNLVRPDPNDTNPARQLGRLFAILEKAQRYALGDEISSTVVDQYLGAAAATPARIMQRLIIAAQTRHIARLKRGRSDSIWIKESKNPIGLAKSVGIGIEQDIATILSKFNDGMPTQLSIEEQGLFLIGYYQERWGATLGKTAAVKNSAIDTAEDQ